MLKNFRKLFKNLSFNQTLHRFSTQLEGVTKTKQDALTLSEMNKLTQKPEEKSLKIRILDELDLPYNIYGNAIEIPQKIKFIAENIMARSKIPPFNLMDHLTKIFMGTVHSIGNQDAEFISEYAETDFGKTLLEKSQNLLKNGYKIEAYEDINGNFGEPIAKSCEFIDMVMVRGVSVNRKENFAEDQYHKFLDNEEMGLVVYTPLEITNPKNFIDPTKNKTLYDCYKKAVMRVLAEIKTNLRLRITRPSGEEITVKLSEYTWKHLVVFETQMKPIGPLKSSYKLENYMEWLTKFTFGVWKIADLDNYMMGNPLIIKHKKSELFADDIFKGTIYDPKARIDLRNI